MKALLGPRGKKLRTLERIFVADGLQSIRSALVPHVTSAPIIDSLYLTDTGYEKIRLEFAQEIIDRHEVIMVTDQVMNAMADTQTPQGMLALCKYLPTDLNRFSAPTQNKSLKRVAYFWQIQDPGNAGTAIRTADACGFDLVIFSDQSVDIYSPKVVRSTVGSLWNIPIINDVSIDQLELFSYEHDLALVALDGSADHNFSDIDTSLPTVLVFGNEGHGLPELAPAFQRVSIPMHGHAESFNVASAAAIAMYFLSI
ncbi:MAG: RNA methyltransferase [Actinomycetota bacterium]